MRIAYLDCFAGISGNMVLAALLDCGLELTRLEAELQKLGLEGTKIVANEVRRHGLRATHVEVQAEEQHAHRHLHDIQAIVEGSGLPSAVKARCLSVFQRLAEAEARVHGTPVDHVHFHEVGALDAIVDIVGSVAGFWLLEVEQVYASYVHVGRGTVRCAHGIIPVPAPATAELLKGVPIYGRDVDAELVTPTGAAILTTLAAGYGGGPAMRVEQIGYGAGSRELPFPNLLRVCIGEALEPVAGAGPAAGEDQTCAGGHQHGGDDAGHHQHGGEGAGHQQHPAPHAGGHHGERGAAGEAGQ